MELMNKSYNTLFISEKVVYTFPYALEVTEVYEYFGGFFKYNEELSK